MHLISHQDENRFNMNARQHENKVQSWQSSQLIKNTLPHLLSGQKDHSSVDGHYVK
jgi:hypothetical protein